VKAGSATRIELRPHVSHRKLRLVSLARFDEMVAGESSLGIESWRRGSVCSFVTTLFVESHVVPLQQNVGETARLSKN
jgi:hypothetical protein